MDGQILVMWRNWLGGARDMYLARSRDGATFSKPEKLGRGTWQLNACPMDGGGLVVSGKRIVTAWRRAEDIYLDEPGEQETKLAAGKDVAISMSRDRVYAAWSSGGEVMLWDSDKTMTLSKTGAFPALTSLTDGGIVAAWEENGAIVTRRF
jgi:hypothetical protein